MLLKLSGMFWHFRFGSCLSLSWSLLDVLGRGTLCLPFHCKIRFANPWFLTFCDCFVDDLSFCSSEFFHISDPFCNVFMFLLEFLFKRCSIVSFLQNGVHTLTYVISLSSFALTCKNKLEDISGNMNVRRIQMSFLELLKSNPGAPTWYKKSGALLYGFDVCFLQLVVPRQVYHSRSSLHSHCLVEYGAGHRSGWDGRGND